MLVVATLLALLTSVAAPAATDDGGTRAVTVAAAATDERGAIVPVVDLLHDGDVLAITVTGGAAWTTGAVRQCRQTATGLQGCSNRFPVQFGDAGGARFQYRLVDPGMCDGSTACVVVVGDDDGARRAIVSTVFGGPAPPAPSVVLTPSGRYEPGQAVRVEVGSLRPGAAVSAAFCAASCGAGTTAAADATGSASIDVTVGARCRDCGIVVVSGTRPTFVPVPFVPAPTASYDVTRLVGGLAVAAAALIAAWRTIVLVDWRPPSEADVPDPDGDVVRAR